MNLRSYIAIFLAIIILGKLVTLDSNILGEIINSDQISYVKKKCDFNSHKKSGDEKFNQTQEGIQITFHSFCNSVFQLEKSLDEKALIQLSFKNNFIYIFTETKEFNYKFIPPPKFS
ncbi:hypothetical protein [Gillisia sp. JM1]|uniref:hypothetical protein n=1 Tax=Gillisia sp. JM1 TaxID=1283286 RepID=UPI00047A55A9|nr:hypothetical protein [Gillisia sp. JM1]